MFISRSDISADGQAMTAANGSRALSLVSLATEGRENRTCQMENVNYSGCGGERCCQQRRRAEGECRGGGLRSAGQGGGAQQHRSSKQRRDDNIQRQMWAVGWRTELFRGQFCQTEPIPVANRWTVHPPRQTRLPCHRQTQLESYKSD